MKFSQQLFKLQTISYKRSKIFIKILFFFFTLHQLQWTHMLDSILPSRTPFLVSALCSSQQFNLLQVCSLFWKLKILSGLVFGIFKSKEITVHVAVKTFRSSKEDVRKSVQRVWVTRAVPGGCVFVCGGLIWLYVSETMHSGNSHSAKKFQIINFMNI